MSEWNSIDDAEEDYGEETNEFIDKIEYTPEEWEQIFSRRWNLVETPNELIVFTEDYVQIPLGKPIFEYFINLHNQGREYVEEYEKQEKRLHEESKRKDNNPLDEGYDLFE